MKPLRLTSAKHEALAIVYFSRRGQMGLGPLGARLLVHPTSVTSTVDALEHLGYVQRTGHPTDRRATLATITARGPAGHPPDVLGAGGAPLGAGRPDRRRRRTSLRGARTGARRRR
jgi:hypothetical protein